MMRILLALFLLCAAAVALAVGAVAALLTQLLPYLFLGGAVWLVLHLARRRGGPVAGPTRRVPPRVSAACPTPLGWTVPPPPGGGWAWMPVWVGPPPRRPHLDVIDVEVVEDHRGG